MMIPRSKVQCHSPEGLSVCYCRAPWSGFYSLDCGLEPNPERRQEGLGSFQSSDHQVETRAVVGSALRGGEKPANLRAGVGCALAERWYVFIPSQTTANLSPGSRGESGVRALSRGRGPVGGQKAAGSWGEGLPCRMHLPLKPALSPGPGGESPGACDLAQAWDASQGKVSLLPCGFPLAWRLHRVFSGAFTCSRWCFPHSSILEREGGRLCEAAAGRKGSQRG